MNVVADALSSRCHLLVTMKNDVVRFESLKEAYKGDAFFSKVIECIINLSVQSNILSKTISCWMGTFFVGSSYVFLWGL